MQFWFLDLTEHLSLELHIEYLKLSLPARVNDVGGVSNFQFRMTTHMFNISYLLICCISMRDMCSSLMNVFSWKVSNLWIYKMSMYVNNLKFPSIYRACMELSVLKSGSWIRVKIWACFHLKLWIESHFLIESAVSSLKLIWCLLNPKNYWNNK